MTSMSARIVNFLLPLTGIKSFFSEPEKVEARLAKMRKRGPALPSARMRREFDISADNSRGFPVYTFLPKGRRQPGTPHIVYYHGGGYIMAISALHWKLVALLCRALGASATVPLYPLAPESKAATILPAMHDVWSDTAGSYGADNITMMGDSAGGGMTLAMAQRLRDAGDPGPARMILLSPWLDATATAPGQAEIEKRDRMLAVSGLKGAGAMYAGELELADPRVSPLFGDLKDLPPVQVFAGTHDILLPDARRFVDGIQKQPDPPPVDYHEYPGMAHVWMILPVREAREARHQMVDFIAGPERQ